MKYQNNVTGLAITMHQLMFEESQLLELISQVRTISAL